MRCKPMDYGKENLPEEKEKKILGEFLWLNNSNFFKKIFLFYVFDILPVCMLSENVGSPINGVTEVVNCHVDAGNCTHIFQASS